MHYYANSNKTLLDLHKKRILSLFFFLKEDLILELYSFIVRQRGFVNL